MAVLKNSGSKYQADQLSHAINQRIAATSVSPMCRRPG